MGLPFSSGHALRLYDRSDRFGRVAVPVLSKIGLRSYPPFGRRNLWATEMGAKPSDGRMGVKRETMGGAAAYHNSECACQPRRCSLAFRRLPDSRTDMPGTGNLYTHPFPGCGWDPTARSRHLRSPAWRTCGLPLVSAHGCSPAGSHSPNRRPRYLSLRSTGGRGRVRISRCSCGQPVRNSLRPGSARGLWDTVLLVPMKEGEAHSGPRLFASPDLTLQWPDGAARSAARRRSCSTRSPRRCRGGRER